MMQLWDKKRCRPVYTTCIQPLTRYRPKKSHLKVRCVAPDESYSLLITCIVSWVITGAMFVRWWLG